MKVHEKFRFLLMCKFLGLKKLLISKTVDAVLKKLYDDSEMIESSDIIIEAPSVNENGRMIPIEIQTNLTKAQSIAIISETNPVPLVGEFKFADNALPWIKTRIKMGGTGKLSVIVKADNKLYIARKYITVNLSVCS